MSVRTFSHNELAELALVILQGAPTYFSADSVGAETDEICKALALVSQANCACFNDRYGAKADPLTADEIKGELHLLDSAPGDARVMARAVSTARLLHYNCDDRGGDFTLKVEGAHAALIHVLTGLAVALARKAGVTT